MTAPFSFADLLQKLHEQSQGRRTPKCYLCNGQPETRLALYEQGWLWMPTIYQWWIDKDKDLTINEDRLIARIDEYIPFDWSGPVHLDLEHPDHIANIENPLRRLTSGRVLQSRQMFTRLLQIIHEHRPLAKAGNWALGRSPKWDRRYGLWAQQTEEQRQLYIDRHLAMDGVYSNTRTLMTCTYDQYAQTAPDDPAWQDEVQASWMDGTVAVAEAIMAKFGIEQNIHTINHRTVDGVPLDREEVWQYQVLPALMAGWDIQWWGADFPEYQLYRQANHAKRRDYARIVADELKLAGIYDLDKQEAETRDYFTHDAKRFGTWLMNRVKQWAAEPEE